MIEKKLRVVSYINQFFGQIGGEDKANTGFLVKEGAIGPSMGLQQKLGEEVDVVATIISGDNYISEDPEGGAEEGLELIKHYDPDLFFAGPAFAAGRYGISCGALCRAVGEKLGIPVITGMYEENPAVEIYRQDVFICKTGNSARTMAETLSNMARLGLKLASGEKGEHLVSRENLPKPDEYGYFPRLIIRNEYTDKNAAARSVEKLLAKIKGEPFETEVQVPKFEVTFSPPPPVKDMSTIEIALVSDGGLVPKGNPDKLVSRENTQWFPYEIDTFMPENPEGAEYDIAHSGYYPVEVLEDPNRLVPLDVMRDLVRESKIRKICPTFFSTSGNCTVHTANLRIGETIAAEIKKREIGAVILTST